MSCCWLTGSKKSELKWGVGRESATRQFRVENLHLIRFHSRNSNMILLLLLRLFLAKPRKLWRLTIRSCTISIHSSHIFHFLCYFFAFLWIHVGRRDILRIEMTFACLGDHNKIYIFSNFTLVLLIAISCTIFSLFAELLLSIFFCDFSAAAECIVSSYQRLNQFHLRVSHFLWRLRLISRVSVFLIILSQCFTISFSSSCLFS